MDINNKIIISFVDIFEPVPDIRQTGKVKHSLLEIIFMAIVATLGGADDWEEIECFCEHKEQWLRKYLTLENGIPSHDTFERCFSWMDPKIFLQCFMQWTMLVSKIVKGGILAIDGKTMRGTADELNGKKALHIVSAWFSETGMVLGQVKTNEKSNEITAIPELLDILDITGCIVTIDAMGTQKDIVRKIIKKHGDYVLALKTNHPLLSDEVVKYFEDAVKDETLDKAKIMNHRESDHGHGRIEVRDYYLTTDIKWLTARKEWEGLTSIGMVKYTSEKNGHKKTDNRYMLCSIGDDIKKFSKAVRSHWGIESMHWNLDVTFNEDARKSKKDHAPENLALLNRLALNILKLDKSMKRSLKKKRFIAGLNQEFLESLFNNCILEDSDK